MFDIVKSIRTTIKKDKIARLLSISPEALDAFEKANNIMMPIFAVMLIIMAIYSLTLPGVKEGLTFMFKPDFSEFNISMILTALGQALFTLSVGMGAMITYGSYMKENTNIVKSAYTLIFFDTLVAITAGIMIFPIVFTFGVKPTAGATLVFISLPEMLAKLSEGGTTVTIDTSKTWFETIASIAPLLLTLLFIFWIVVGNSIEYKHSSLM